MVASGSSEVLPENPFGPRPGLVRESGSLGANEAAFPVDLDVLAAERPSPELCLSFPRPSGASSKIASAILESSTFAA